MGTLLVGANILDADVVSPNPGEKVRAAAGMAGSVRDPLQALLDRATAVRMGLYGYVGHRGSVWDAAAGDETVFDAPGAFVVTSAGDWVVIPAVDPITVATWGAMDSDGNAFVADTRYWVYLYDDAGVPGVWIVPTEPGPSGLYMDDGGGADDTDFVLLSTAVYNSAGAAFIDQSQTGRICQYTQFIAPTGTAADNRVMDAGNSTVMATINCSPWVASTSKRFRFKIEALFANLAGTAYFRIYGNTGSDYLFIRQGPSGQASTSFDEITFDTKGGVAFSYDVGNAGNFLEGWIIDYDF